MHSFKSNKAFDLTLKEKSMFKLPIQGQPDAHKEQCFALIENQRGGLSSRSGL